MISTQGNIILYDSTDTSDIKLLSREYIDGISWTITDADISDNGDFASNHLI